MPKEQKAARLKENKIASLRRFATRRELIVKTRPEAAVRADAQGLRSATPSEGNAIDSLLKSSKAKLLPIFGGARRTARAMAARPAESEIRPKMETFFRVEADDERLDEIAKKLLKIESVDAAYVKPRAMPPVILEDAILPPNAEEPPAVTPDFTSQQLYLDPAPVGIDARYAWARPGGKGEGVQIIDIEGAWRFSHEDLIQNPGGIIGAPAQPDDLLWRNHGTAVVGILRGEENSMGVTGICPATNVRAISIFAAGQSTAKAITDAADLLNPGDLILIELHSPGPRFNFQAPQGDKGYVPMEFWPDVFAAIQYATSVRGVIVVEAGGNGWENLDDPLYENAPPGFPSDWTNPFNLANPQSGAIMVGAGAPPTGTHGANHGPDRSRLYFSNYGTRIDAQGWGREVTTCGYGDLQGGTDEDLWYTNIFGGTSSASPIVLGAIACAQGVRSAAGAPLLTPGEAQNLLRTTGSPQQDFLPLFPATQRIGSRPDLRQLISSVAGVTTVPLHRYWNSVEGDHFYTSDINELGTGQFGWVYEWVQCHIAPRQVAGMIPLFRYWNPDVGDHFYTTDWNELGTSQYGWQYEWIQGFVYPGEVAGAIPLYRYWNSGAGDHFYTTDFNELGEGRFGWVYEKIQCYVFAEETVIPEVAAQNISAAAADTGPVDGPPETFRACPTPSGNSSEEQGTGSFGLQQPTVTSDSTRPRSFSPRKSAPGAVSSTSGRIIINVHASS